MDYWIIKDCFKKRRQTKCEKMPCQPYSKVSLIKAQGITLEWFQMKTHFFKQTSGSDKVLAHAIRSNLRQILFENFHG